MATFFVTTRIKKDGKPFQFRFSTDEAQTVEQIVDILNDGELVAGKKSSSASGALDEDFAISGADISFINLAK